MGGAGDIGAKIEAEVARTGMSADEIGSKVRIMLLVGLNLNEDFVSKRYTIIQKGNSFGFLAFLQCMTTNFFLRT